MGGQLRGSTGGEDKNRQRLNNTEKNNKNTKKPVNNENEKLTYLYSNVDSFRDKKEEILILVNEHNPDLIGLVELKPKTGTYTLVEADWHIDGYDAWPKLSSPGRGVVLYTRQSLQAVEAQCNITYNDSIFCKIKLRDNDNLVVGTIYRSPNSSCENNDKLHEVMTWAVESGCSHFVCAGDTNMKEIDWESNTCSASENHHASKFLTLTSDLFLHQFVDRPTHYRGLQTANRLDVVFANEENIVSNITYLPPIGSSHHLTLLCEIQCYTKNTLSAPREILKVHNGNYDQFRQHIRDHNWQYELGVSSTDEIWDEISGVMDTGTAKFIPKCVITINNKRRKPLWMNARALAKVKAKHQSFNRYLRTREGEDYTKYCKARNKARKATRKALKYYEREIAKNAKKNPKAFYKLVNSKTKVASSVSELHTSDGKTASTDRDKAEVLNDYFSSVFTVENESDIPDIQVNDVPETPLSDINFDRDDVIKRMKTLNGNKATGPDNIYPKMMKELADELGPVLFDLFVTSISTGEIPRKWKQANVTPIFKKGSRHDPGNYRPVSLTSAVCKLLERLISESLFEHLARTLSPHQHGFRKGRSCMTQMMEVVETWTDMLEQNIPIDCVYFDFKKAFDSVPHKRLLAKLKAHNVEGNVFRWIENYLSDRTQRVVVNGAASAEAKVTSGVPQGSVLGPTLFVLFINDLPQEATSNLRLFADDTKLFGPAKTVSECEILQTDINRLQDWADDWQMTFHPNKCKYMRIGRGHAEYSYSMKDGETVVQLEQTNVEKDLGIQTDSALSFDNHIMAAVSKGKQLVGLIKRSFRYLDGNVVTLLFKSLVRPVLEYGHSIWNPKFKKHIKALEAVQRRATRLVPSLKNLEYGERLKALRLPSLQYRRRRGDMIETWKILHNVYDNISFPWLVRDIDSVVRGNSLKLKKIGKSNPQKRRAFSFRITQDWNSLPDNVVTAQSINSFKAGLDRFWHDQQYIYTE